MIRTISFGADCPNEIITISVGISCFCLFASGLKLTWYISRFFPYFYYNETLHPFVRNIHIYLHLFMQRLYSAAVMLMPYIGVAHVFAWQNVIFEYRSGWRLDWSDLLNTQVLYIYNAIIGIHICTCIYVYSYGICTTLL